MQSALNIGSKKTRGIPKYTPLRNKFILFGEQPQDPYSPHSLQERVPR